MLPPWNERQRDRQEEKYASQYRSREQRDPNGGEKMRKQTKQMVQEARLQRRLPVGASYDGSMELWAGQSAGAFRSDGSLVRA